MRPLLVLNVVGLTPALLRHAPRIASVGAGGFTASLEPVLPAVTCSAQATLITGKPPRDHGIVANGWYFRDLAEIWLWRQSNRLVQCEPDKLWNVARERFGDELTVAKMFWWYNMYADVDWSVTPRPSYPADGRKVFDSYSNPPELRDRLQRQLGTFPLLHFWGPGADIASSRWIADACLQVIREYNPTLTLVYLPHLDYNLQRLGPDNPRIAEDLREVDAEAGKLIDAARSRGAEVVVLSEYAITEVSRPVHINRILRAHGYLEARREPLSWETLDAGASRAFAVSDHQVAHIYVRHAGDVTHVAELLRTCDGIDRVLDREQQGEFGIDHARSGDLVAVAAPECWFTYYFWLDDALAPDCARTVDIHRKPGYDPVELFLDPKLRLPKLRIARRLAQKLLGFRYYMDVIGLDASIVKGSHGRLPRPGRENSEGPVFICSSKAIERDEIPMCTVKELLLKLQFD